MVQSTTKGEGYNTIRGWSHLGVRREEAPPDHALQENEIMHTTGAAGTQHNGRPFRTTDQQLTSGSKFAELYTEIKHFQVCHAEKKKN